MSLMLRRGRMIMYSITGTSVGRGIIVTVMTVVTVVRLLLLLLVG